MILELPGEGYSRYAVILSVPGEGYSRYYREGYSRDYLVKVILDMP